MRLRQFTIVPAALCALLATTLAGPGDTAAVDHAAAAPAGAPVALTGRVFTTTPEDPVRLRAVVWPTQATLDRLPIGAAVPLIDVDAVETAGNTYTVRLDPATLPASHVTDGRQVDLEITATSGDTALQRRTSTATDSYNESLVHRAGSWTRSPAAIGLTSQLTDGRPFAALTRGQLVKLPGNLAVDQAGTGRVNARGVVLTGLAPATLTSTAARAGAAREPICSTNKTSQTQERRAKISDVMPKKGIVQGRVSYDFESSHELGVGVKHVTGGFDASGTLKRTSSEQVTPELVYRNHTARTDWLYRHYKNSCTGKLTARPESHEGGYYKPRRSHPDYYEHCKGYPAGTWKFASATAWTYQAGVTLWKVLNVDAQAGYNDKVTLEYYLHKRHKLCGNNANPPSAELVAAK